ncbi:hypothetical protein M3Y97_00101200 [Aphelenchoides bicaudatus]|nr:hypothetical protein M3Y97_00101200 [Aphelenchoides bicaudatus]
MKEICQSSPNSIRHVICHHTKKLKYRQEPEIEEGHPKDLRRSLEEREARSRDDSKTSVLGIMPPPKRLRQEEEEQNPDVDDPLDEAVSDNSDSDDDSEDEAALMAELAAIKKERAAERAENEARQKAEQDRIRHEDLLVANPLLQAQGSSNFAVKRRWDDDVVFKNCAKGTDERKKQPNFINDSIRSDFHRKFMSKYIT